MSVALPVLAALVAARVHRPIVLVGEGEIVVLAGSCEYVVRALVGAGEVELARQLQALAAEPVAIIVEAVDGRARLSTARLEPLARGGDA